MNKSNWLQSILGDLAQELFDYDTRMVQAGAPPIRFVHKYTSKSAKAIQAHLREAIGEDELVSHEDLHDWQEGRNKLRAELRKTLGLEEK